MTLGDFIYCLCWISIIFYAIYNKMKINGMRKECGENHITERDYQFIDKMIDLTPGQDEFAKQLCEKLGMVHRIRYKLAALKDKEVHKCQK